MADVRNLDEYLQRRLSRARVVAWWRDTKYIENYTGPRQKLIWEAFRQLEEQMGDVAGKITVATAGRERRLDFIYETFGLAYWRFTTDCWTLMPSGEREADLLESIKTHSERKILDALKGKWTEELFIFVSKSPCCDCSEALVKHLGKAAEGGRFGHLVVAFLDYYGGPSRLTDEDKQKGRTREERALPSRNFWLAVANNKIEFFKVVWNDVDDDQRRDSRQKRIAEAGRARTPYDYMSLSWVPEATVYDQASNRWMPAPNPDRLPFVGIGGLPADPRFQLIRFEAT